VVYTRQRWAAPDGDFIDLDWIQGPPSTTLLVLFHGLEGSSNSHYARAFAAYALRHGFSFVVPHFRGCSGELNLAPRAYHSGDFEEIDWVLKRLRQNHKGQLLAVGVSLGGNALLRWAQEFGATAAHTVQALVSISAPLDLAASGQAIGRGFNRQVYTRRFMATMKPKAFKKLAQYPGLFDAEALQVANDLYAFDNAFTAPLHGFKNTDDYYQRASSKTRLAEIKVPTLVINAKNDPFVLVNSLPIPNEVGSSVQLWQPPQGGHVGFVAGWPPGHLATLPEIVGEWLINQGVAGG
jgi:predicted alpha/beta-fold hydrolase